MNRWATDKELYDGGMAELHREARVAGAVEPAVPCTPSPGSAAWQSNSRPPCPVRLSVAVTGPPDWS
jgi:hypothetical protein